MKPSEVFKVLGSTLPMFFFFIYSASIGGQSLCEPTP